MDSRTQEVLKMDLAHLTKDQIQYLHDLKAEATKGWASKMLADLRKAA